MSGNSSKEVTAAGARPKDSLDWNGAVKQLAELAAGSVAACLKSHQQLHTLCSGIAGLASDMALPSATLSADSATKQLKQLIVVIKLLQLPQLLVKLLQARKRPREWKQPEYCSCIKSVLTATLAIFCTACLFDDGAEVSDSVTAAKELVTPQAIAAAAAAQKELAQLLCKQQQQQTRQLLELSVELLRWWQIAFKLLDGAAAAKNVGAASLLEESSQTVAALAVAVAQRIPSSIDNSINGTAVSVLLTADRFQQRFHQQIEHHSSGGDAAFDDTHLLQHPACLRLAILDAIVHTHRMQCLLTAAVVAAKQPSCGCDAGSRTDSSSSSISSGVSCPASSATDAPSMPAAAAAATTAAEQPQPQLLAQLTQQAWQALGMSPAALEDFAAARGDVAAGGLLAQDFLQHSQGNHATPTMPSAVAAAIRDSASAAQYMTHIMRRVRHHNGSGAVIWEELSPQHQQLLQAVSWQMPPLLLGAELQCCPDNIVINKVAVEAALHAAAEFVRCWGHVGFKAAAVSPAAVAAVEAVADRGSDAEPEAAAAARAVLAAMGAGNGAQQSARMLLFLTLHSCLLLMQHHLTGSGPLAVAIAAGQISASSSTLACRDLTTVTISLVVLEAIADEATKDAWAAPVRASLANDIMATLELLIRKVPCWHFSHSSDCGEQLPEQPEGQDQQQQQDTRGADASCSSVTALYIELTELLKGLAIYDNILLSLPPSGLLRLQWQQQQWQQHFFSVAASYLKLCHIAPEAADTETMHLLLSKLAKFHEMLAQGKPGCLVQQQAAMAPWGVLCGRTFLRAGALLQIMCSDSATVLAEAAQQQQQGSSSADCSDSQSPSNEAVALHLEGLVKVLEQIKLVGAEMNAALHLTPFGQGDHPKQHQVQQEEQQHSQQTVEQQVQQQDEDRGVSAAAAEAADNAALRCLPRYALLNASALDRVMPCYDRFLLTAKGASAVAAAVSTHCQHDSGREDAHPSGGNKGNTRSKHDGCSVAPQGEHFSLTSTAAGLKDKDDDEHVAAAKRAKSPGEALSVLLLCPYVAKLPHLLQETGELLCAALPVPWLCNNPDCSNMACSSELLLVGGKGCVCGGCRVARYCGRTCQAAHWIRHRPVCKDMVAAAAADEAAAEEFAATEQQVQQSVGS